MAERLFKHGQELDGPAVHCGMIDRNSTLGHHFLEMTQAKQIGDVSTHAGQDHFQRIVQPLSTGASPGSSVFILHPRTISIEADCQNALLRQNPPDLIRMF